MCPMPMNAVTNASVNETHEPFYLLEKAGCKDRIKLGKWQHRQELHRTIKDQGCFCTEEISSVPEMTEVHADIQRSLNAVRPLNEQQNFGVRLALEEALKNGIRDRQHNGMPFEPEQYRTAVVQYGVLPRNVVEVDPRPHFLLRVQDQGSGFNPRNVLNGAHPENKERIHGQGLWIITHFLCLKKNAHLDARITFLPKHPLNDGTDFLTSDMIIQMPLEGDPNALMDKFLSATRPLRKYPDFWKPRSSPNDETVT